MATTKVKKEQPAKERKDAEKELQTREERIENIVAVIVVVVVIGLAAWWIYQRATAPLALPEQRIEIPLGASPVIGSETAPITIILFSDFECPFCGQFARDQYPAFKERFIDTGKVRFSYKHFPLEQIHERAMPAAIAAYCAHEQQEFWEYHDLLYADQDKLDDASLRRYAQEAGLDVALFDVCVANPTTRKLVLQDKDLGIQSGVTGTPTFFIDGRQVTGYRTADELAALIEG
jgi:protein-disulfide isomerase